MIESSNSRSPSTDFLSRPAGLLQRSGSCTVTAATLLLACSGIVLADSDGTAIIRTTDTEYTIPIMCREEQNGLDIATEPSRGTREATGRSSGVRLNIRPWRETSDIIVTLGRYVAWLPAQPTAGGKLQLEIDMSPSSIMRDGAPALLTYDMWMDGERPEGLKNVWIQADCNFRDPGAPKTQKL